MTFIPQPISHASGELPCATCGYDLRMQPREGICPECATPVQKAIELAAVPLRPAWRDSDPRWRRRMVAGAWILALLPLVAAVQQSQLAARIRVPVTAYVGDLTLNESFFTYIYTYLIFCIGIVLFFAKERGRRRDRLDWTRRWGVFVSYVVLLLGAASWSLITGLVLIGIAALFMTLPRENQPAVTGTVTEVGAALLMYGPDAGEAAWVALAAASAVAVLLACVPIHTGLRSSGGRALAWLLPAPLALTALWLIGHAALWVVHHPAARASPPEPFYEAPWYLLSGLGDLVQDFNGQYSVLLDVAREAARWLPFLVIAIWLSTAQVRAWRKSPVPQPGAP